MNNYKFIILLGLSIMVFSCSNSRNEPEKEEAIRYTLQVIPIDLKIENHFRGLHVLDENTVWVSGTGGFYLKTIDGGQGWMTDSIEGLENSDLRDIEAFNQQVSLVLTAGFPGKIFKTIDGGFNWKEVYSNLDSLVFFDGMDFWNENIGIAYGDPLNGKTLAIRTEDGGETWNAIESLPKPNKVEGGFAASGTGIVTNGNGNVWLGFGGEQARIMMSFDFGKNWLAQNSPMLQGTQMQGIYSMAFKNELEGVAVGGEWNNPSPEKSKIFTKDGGKSWSLGKGVNQYRSGSCYVSDNIYLACGTSGVDITYDGGETWLQIDSTNLNSIQFAPNSFIGYGVSNNGIIVKLMLVSNTNLLGKDLVK